MIDLRQPKYEWGQRVFAEIDLINDGSYPDYPQEAVLVSAGSQGEIINVGHHHDANVPIYLVEFTSGHVVGCLEEEIRLG
ncbi:MAG: nitrogen fixation protein NifZ [Methylococcaceae bacterium]|jgi:nitrogen fixation protein NifZ